MRPLCRRPRPSIALLAPSLAVVLAFAAPAVGAAQAAAADAPPPPADRLEIGVEERVRWENWDDITDFNSATADARHQLRLRTRLWGKVTLGPRFEAMLGFNNESRKIYTPDTPMKLDEIIFETLYLHYRVSDRVAARLGRQDLRFGDAFLVFEGGPLDGSRSRYVNALEVTWTPGVSKFSFLGISDPHQDLYLPVINDKDRALIEVDEQALGVYFTAGGLERMALDAYYFAKWESDDTRATTSAAYQGDRSVHTLGARWSRQFTGGWSTAAEVAGQVGKQDPDDDVRGWAATGTVKKAFAGAAKPSLSVGYLGLSGDDPGSGDIEAWDPLFSRWPKWSEAFLYTLGSEKGSSYWTNLSALQAEFLISPTPALDLRATYYLMGAFYRWPGKPEIYGDGTTRGNLYQARADLKAGGSWRAHLVGEWFEPGSFYAGTDGGWFLRAEATYTFRHTFAL